MDPVILFHGSFPSTYVVSQSPGTPALGGLTASSGLYRHLHAYTHRFMCAISKGKSRLRVPNNRSSAMVP